MDLRIQKTRRAIRDTFLNLRASKELNQITVKELCHQAQISKGTFYLHYRDLFDLSDHLQRELIRRILNRIDTPLDTPEHLDRFIYQLKEAMDSEEGITADPLFSGVQRPLFPILLVEELKKMLFEKQPGLKDDVRINVWLSYHIYGGYYAFVENKKCFDTNSVLDTLQQIHHQPERTR